MTDSLKKALRDTNEFFAEEKVEGNSPIVYTPSKVSSFWGSSSNSSNSGSSWGRSAIEGAVSGSTGAIAGMAVSTAVAGSNSHIQGIEDQITRKFDKSIPSATKFAVSKETVLGALGL